MKYLRVTLQKFPSMKPVVAVKAGNPEPFPETEPGAKPRWRSMRPALEVTILTKLS